MRFFSTFIRNLLLGVGFAFGKGLSVLDQGFSAGFPPARKISPFSMRLRESAVRESADFFLANMRQASIVGRRQEIWQAALERTGGVRGLILEFGVWKGESLTWFARHSKQEVFGFDNFYDGLEEDWAGSLPKGFFAQKSLPKVPGNATLIVGKAQDELPGFLQGHPEPIRVAHFDMDTYQSSLDVLRLIYPRLVAGSVVIFDEFFNFPLWQEGEYRAWTEFVAETGIDFKYFSTSGEQVGVEIG